jgi:hypothetical protein
MRGLMRRSQVIVRCASLLSLVMVPALARGQGAGLGTTPLALDLKKVPVGTWAEYTVNIHAEQAMTMKSRWALVARDANTTTLETRVEGPALAMMGGRMVMRVALVPDPLSAEKPIKQTVVQMGDRDPMEMPLNMPNMPPQRFQKPDPKKMVGKEELKVAGGTFKTSHYHDVTERGVIDIWVNDGVGPLGVVKMSASPEKPDPRMPAVTMELAARGKDAKPLITKTPKPFDPSAFGPPPGAGGHGGPGTARPGTSPSPAEKPPAAPARP